jgi:NADH-quinone oxidoreductase subunit E
VHLSQEQNGYVTEEAMRHVAELVEVTPAEVYGTASFYEMFRFEPTGKYLINVCGTMSCALLGAGSLMHHAEHKLGIKAGSTTEDGLITLQHAECQAACTEAPTLQVNYRHRYRVTNESFDQLVDDLRAGRLDGEIPPHGTLGRNRQQIPADRAVGARHPDDVHEAPAWIPVSPA